MKTVITIALLLLIGCNNTSKLMNDMPALPDKLELGLSVLSQDTVPKFTFPTITEDQHRELQQKSIEAPDSTRLIGVREIEGNCTLEAYLVPTGEDPNQFKVILVTRSEKGLLIDAIDLGEFHTSEHQGPMRFGGNRFYTLDTDVTFNGKNRFTVHRVMTLTSLYLKDHRLTEMWRVEWDDHYKIDNSAHITFTNQQETHRTEPVDDPTIEQYKSRINQPYSLSPQPVEVMQGSAL